MPRSDWREVPLCFVLILVPALLFAGLWCALYGACL